MNSAQTNNERFKNMSRSRKEDEGRRGSSSTESPDKIEEQRNCDGNNAMDNEQIFEHTSVVDANLPGFIARAQELEKKIMEKYKIQFVEQMERIKEELSQFVSEQTEVWLKTTSENHEAFRRLEASCNLVHSLGLETVQYK